MPNRTCGGRSVATHSLLASLSFASLSCASLFSFRGWRGGVLAVSVTLAGASAYAQDAAIEAAQKEEVRRRAEQQQRLDQEAKDFNERNQRSQEPQVNLSTPTPKPIPLRQGAQESSSPCFDNTQITLTPLPQLDPEAQALGNSLLSQWWLGWRIRRVIARYQGIV